MAESLAFLAARPLTTVQHAGLPAQQNLQRSQAAQSPGLRTSVQSSGANVAWVALGLAGTAAFAAGRRRRKRSARTAAHGWGDPVDFFDATVRDNVEAADGLRLITVEAPKTVAGPFERAGQFVQAKGSGDAKPSFYAISSPPGGDGPLEFLIKDAESNEWFTSTKGGDPVLLSAAMGKGYATDCDAWSSAEVSQVGLFATGSGISPVRAAVESGVLSGKNCRLYLGAQTEAKLAFSDRFESWKKLGVEVVPVLSKPDNNWTGRRGYVQDAFKEDEERGEGFVLAAKHGAILCGQKEMVAAVREVYSGLGVPEERTLLNF